jgi:hypothetical protein
MDFGDIYIFLSLICAATVAAPNRIALPIIYAPECSGKNSRNPTIKKKMLITMEVDIMVYLSLSC